MRSGFERTVRVVVTGSLLSALAGCGADSAAPPMTVITPAPVRAVIAQTSFSDFETDVWIQIEVILTQRGVLDIMVDWTYPDTWMYVYFGQTKCDFAQLSGRKCPFVLSSETKDPKPRVLYTETLDPASYYLVLYNVPRDPRTGKGSDNKEAVSIQLGLTVFPTAQGPTEGLSLGRPTVVSPPRL